MLPDDRLLRYVLIKESLKLERKERETLSFRIQVLEEEVDQLRQKESLLNEMLTLFSAKVTANFVEEYNKKRKLSHGS